MGNEAKSPMRTMRERLAEIREMSKTAQKAELALASKIDDQIKNAGTPLTGGDAKLRAEHGENVLSTGAKNDEGLKIQTTIPVTQVMEPVNKSVGVTVTTREKKAKWLAVAEKTAALTSTEKTAAAIRAPEQSIMQGIAKQASVYNDPAAVTYHEASKAAAAIMATKYIGTLKGIEKRAQATLEGTDNLDQELAANPALLEEILKINAITPDGAMTPEEHSAILQESDAGDLSEAAGIVAGNTGDGAELPEADEEKVEELKKIEKEVEDAEGKGEGDGKEEKGCKCGDPECKGCDMDSEEKTACKNHAYLCQYINALRSPAAEKVAAFRRMPSAESVALRKIAVLQRTVEGLKGVIAGQDAELAQMESLQDKVASLEKAASKVQTVNPDMVNTMFAEAVRANLISGPETEIQNMKLAALSSPEKLAETACQMIRTAAAKQTNKLGSVARAAIRTEDAEKAASVTDALANLRKTIATARK